MVSAHLADALANPTRVLLDLYASQTSDPFEKQVSKHFGDVFASDAAFNEVRIPRKISGTRLSPEQFLRSHH
jgi:hypothetical protein